MAFGYPVFLDLTDVPVLVVGGGIIALRKTQGLKAAGAQVTVIAPEINDELRGLATVLHQRPYRAGDAAKFRLVITATSESEVNAQVARDATAAGVWVNSADDPTNCSFILPAVARQGDVTVAVSTGGASPALATRLRADIAEKILTPGVAAAAVELARQRAEVHGEGKSTEDIAWADRVEAALRNATGEPPAPR